MLFYTSKNDQLQQVFQTPHLEWCNLINRGQLRKYTAIKFFFNTYGKFLKMFLKCPVVGEIAIKDFKPDSKLFAFLPSGTYVYAINANVTTSQGVKGTFRLRLFTEVNGYF
jgi:hypothetical protein